MEKWWIKSINCEELPVNRYKELGISMISLPNALISLQEEIPFLSRNKFLRLCGYIGKHSIISPDEIKIYKDVKSKTVRYYISKECINLFLEAYKKWVNDVVNSNNLIYIDDYAKENNISRRTVERRIIEGRLTSVFYNKKTYILKEVKTYE